MYYIVEVDNGQIVIVDSAGNAVTSQASGSQRALDVGINVSGAHVDPRQIRSLTTADVVTSRVNDGAGQALTSTLVGTKQSLDVAIQSIASGGDTIIRDPVTAANKMTINPDGSINVKTVQTAPPNTIPVEMWVKGNVSGSTSVDTRYRIPNNTTIILQWHSGGFIGSGNFSATQIWYDPTGAITASSYLHSNFYFNIGSMAESIAGTYLGNGTKSIIARRQRIDATAREGFIRWYGYLTYNTYTTNDSGTTTGTTATTITDSTKAWTVNAHAGRYVMVNDKTPLYIISNTATVLTVEFNADLLTSQAYKIVTFNV